MTTGNIQLSLLSMCFLPKRLRPSLIHVRSRGSLYGTNAVLRATLSLSSELRRTGYSRGACDIVGVVVEYIARALTNSCLTRVVWTLRTFGNNLGINHKFTKYLKESCGADFDQHFIFRYFLKIRIVKEISPK